MVDLWRPHFKARFPVVATSPNRSFHKNSRTSIIHSSLHPIRRMDAPLDMDGTSPRSRKLSTSIPIRLQTLFGRSRSPFPLVLSKPLHCRRRCHGRGPDLFPGDPLVHRSHSNPFALMQPGGVSLNRTIEEARDSGAEGARARAHDCTWCIL